MEKVNIGVVGAGGIANGIHLPVLARLEGVQLQAVCDLREERAQGAAERFGFAHTYTSYYEMLAREELDALFILTQPDALFRVASDCLAAGKAVFMEKPMGVTAYQAKTLQAQAEAQGRLLQVGYNRRYIPLVSEALRLVREQGAITLAEGWFYKNSSPAFYGGCASAFTCDVVHVVDLVRHAACGGAAGGSAKSATLASAQGDAWHSILQFENGAAGVVRSHYSTGGRTHGFAFHAPGASAFVDLGSTENDCAATVVRAKGQGRQSLSAMGAGETEVLRLDGKAIAGSDRYEDYYGYREEDALFITAVRAGGKYDAAHTQADLATACLVEELLDSQI
ncbi:MAG: Gfo/Idh/MocA family oxidoreductase [Oscillospiraceae bacterium]|jgi:predicted dehydrogenase|nr:Gfo/Idh/MocA family oxidoreductase [Oscillospiraceae bacterium]